MSKDRELQSRRRQVILEILAGDEKIAEQKDLVEKLHARGMPATQSNISRDLKALGAVRSEGYYEIPSWNVDKEGPPIRRVVQLIREVRPCGPYQILLVTDTGAGRIVTQALNESAWEDVVGTVDGDSSVLILTENIFFQRTVYSKLKRYLSESEDS